ncbi:MAG: DUF721 domain-containing protein [Alphaproteobacteria bacterium]
MSVEERRGTRSLAQLVPRITGRALGRRGAAVAGLISKWPDIVGPAIARASLPRKLTFPKGERSGGTLQIAVAGSLAIELQHLEPQVLERINGFLGYGAVKRLRLVQDMTVIPKRQRQMAEEADADPAETGGNADPDGLGTALARLEKAVAKAEIHRQGRKGK